MAMSRIFFITFASISVVLAACGVDDGKLQPGSDQPMDTGVPSPTHASTANDVDQTQSGGQSEVVPTLDVQDKMHEVVALRPGETTYRMVTGRAIAEELRLVGDEEKAREFDNVADSIPCKVVQTSQYGTNLFGSKIWEFFEKIEWCFDGRKVYSGFVRSWASVYYPLWRFDGTREGSSGGAGYSYYSAYAQGTFSLCAAANIGCVQQSTPYLELTGYADGSFR